MGHALLYITVWRRDNGTCFARYITKCIKKRVGHALLYITNCMEKGQWDMLCYT